MKKEDVSKVFSSETEFEEAYERFLSSLPQVGEEITGRHERMEACFMAYLDAFERWVFRHAYGAGYAAAMAGTEGTGAR